MIDPLVKFLQSIPAATLALVPCTITDTGPVQVRLPDGSTITPGTVAGLTYSKNTPGYALVAAGAGAVVWPATPAATTAPVDAGETTTTTTTGDSGTTTTTTTGTAATGSTAVPSFTVTQTDLTINVDASATTGAAVYTWAFGDDSTAVGVTATHTYTTAGAYTVVLTVADSTGQTASSSNPVTVATSTTVVVTPPTAPPAQPTGDAIIRYQDLPGATFDRKLDAAPNSRTVSLPVGTIQFSNFAADDSYGATTDGAGIAGAGRGSDGSIITIKPGSSSKASKVPTSKGSTTNPLYLLKFTRTSGVNLSGFSLVGTSQGHLYNGLRIDRSAGPTVSNVRISHVPGNSDINPGETFYVNFYRCTGVRMSDCEIDGDDVGASGIGFNTCHGGIHVADVSTHDLKYCKGVALWEQSGGGTFTRFQSLNNAFAFGFERCDGTYTLNQPKFRGSTRADIHLANDGGQWGRAHLVINDPDLDTGQRIKVLLSKTELGNTNRQTRDDVRVYVKGKDRTADLVQFATSA